MRTVSKIARSGSFGRNWGVMPFAAALVWSFLASTAFGQQTDLQLSLPGLPQPGESLVELKIEVQGTSGGVLSGVVTASVREGWHINSSTPLDSFAIPSELKIESSAFRIERIQFPPHELRAFGFTDGKKLAVLEGAVPIRFTAIKLAEKGPVRATLRYQACNDRVCLPPKSATAELSFDAAIIPVATGSSTSEKSVTFVPLSAALKPGSLFSSDIQSTFSSRGLPLTLIAVFLLGLALNLTPCVYPLIPITIAFFSSQSEGRRSQRTLLSIFYVIGIAVTYSALGVFSALSGRLFGAWLQLPPVLIFFALLMLVLAASMFGLFEIRIPHFITDRAGARGGYLGSFTMGLLIGVVAAPCVGPFVISLIALVGQVGNPYLGFTLFFVLALGLGVPYLLLGIFSSGVASIPRSGLWMVQVKQAMGFVLIAMSIYFLRPLIGEEWFRWGMAASLIAGAMFLFATGRAGNAGGHAIRLACAVLLLGAGVWFAAQRTREGLVWEKYSPQALEAARQAGKPAVIDFYADWCLPCKELDAKTFTHAGVRQEAGRFIRLKADLTSAEDVVSKELTSRYAILGVPTIVLVDSRGNEVKALRLTGFEEPAAFQQRLKAVH